MSGGDKTLIVNPAERIVSSDANRLQAFNIANRAEFYRYLFDAEATENESGGVISLVATTTSPLRAEVINGLLPQPGLANTNLLIKPGVLVMVNPDAVVNADDSPFKIVQDPGLANGTLFLAPNGAGSTRIDVIECSRNPDVVVETASRDVFEVTTGLFTPQTVDKAKTDRLTYRIRQGTAGAGFPGTASGWLPLAVARVPNGATTWDDCDLWDVRPLVSDHVRTPFRVTQPYPHSAMQYALAETPDGIARNLTGVIELEFGSRRVGGNFNVAPIAALDIRESNTSVVEPGFVASPGLWFVYLAFPFSLPRWCKYFPASAGKREPAGLRGIPVYTQQASDYVSGAPSSIIAMPTALGFGVHNTTDAVMAIAGVYATVGTTWLNSVMSGKWTHVSGAQTFGPALPLTGAASDTNVFDFGSDDFFPSRATRLRVRVSMTVRVEADAGLGAGGSAIQETTFTIRMFGSAGTNLIWIHSEILNVFQYSADANNRIVRTVEVPVHPNMPTGFQDITRRMTVTVDLGVLPAASVVTGCSANVLGWEMGL